MLPDLIERQLTRIVSSAGFAGSPRMVRFLEFVVREVLRGNASELKEFVIGSSVFDRDSNYDPRLDPIVRVEARRLRSKLEAWYETEGKDDEIIIELPRGSYAPVIRQRSAGTVQPIDSHRQPVQSIAILPFRNLHAENDGAYFTDGLAEELITALTRVPGLRVVAWNTASQFREQDADMDSIRRQLNVGYVLRGSLRKTGQRLRIAAQLVETATGHYLWSETWDRQIYDVFAIQEQIAAAIADALKVRILHPPSARAARHVCVDSWQICLKGRFHARDRNPDGLRRSVMCFEQAIAVCAESASAWAGLADSWTLLAEYELEEPAKALPKARAAAEKALALDPNSEEAHASLGLIYCVHDWRWADGARMFERAITLNPGYVNAHHWYAMDHLAVRGEFAEARKHIRIATELDPLSNLILEQHAFLHTLERNYDAAVQHLRSMLDADPSFYKAWTSLGRALIQKGAYREAIEALRKGRQLAGDLPNILGALGQAYGLAGDDAAARGILAQLADLAAHRPVRFTCFALVHLGLGETEQALDFLERATNAREANVACLYVHPLWDPLRSQPRFRKLLNQTGF
jgi:TolB-like protein/Flp pilus assembly protein TadD